MLNFYNNIKDPSVMGEIDVYDFLDRIKNPDSITNKKIKLARIYKSQEAIDEYQKLKAGLPCFTLNFSFNGRKTNATIKEPTGLIYIDVDNNVDIDLQNPLIFASWLSLSGLGRGVLVKVDNLTLDNFNINYIEIANNLNIEADRHAGKATQYCIHSYDKDVYINNHSITYQAKGVIKSTPITVLYKKETKDTQVKGVKYKVVYDNIEDLSFGNKDYLFFPNEKKYTAKAFIPSSISNGSRNNTISMMAYQLRALNPDQPENEFKSFILSINSSRCSNPLSDAEVLKIVSKIIKSDISEPIFNEPRRIIYNPKSKLTKKERRTITNRYLGQLKCENTKSEIKLCLQNWDTNTHGKVTQKKLAKVSRKNIKTIEKYYKNFKLIIEGINQHNKNLD